MKRCPECRRDYYDDTLLYCLDDGNALLEGPAVPVSDLATLVMPRAETALAEMSSSVADRPLRTSKEYSNAVAVLPFANLSGADDSEYLSEGLAEELINVLSKIKGIRVVARTSAFAFKGRQIGVADIGRILRVRSILDGSVRMAGERVRVAVQLINVEDGYNLWSETYDRRMTDIFAIQDEIAGSVVGELRERLLQVGTGITARGDVADEIAHAIRGRSRDPEAYRLMLLGRHILDRANENDSITAVEYLQESLEIDPNNAFCWVLLGRAYFEASNFGWRTLDVDYQNAEEALQRAIALEPDLAEGLARLGRIRWYRDGDFQSAEEYLTRALTMAPDDAVVLISASSMLKDLGQFEKALEYCRRATDIDPVGILAWQATAYANFLGGDLSAAETAVKRTLELAPQRIFTHALLALILHKQGRNEDALAQAFSEPDEFWRSWSLSIIHHEIGRHVDSDIEFAKLIDLGDDSAFQIAEVYAVRGEIDEAFASLEQAVVRRDPGKAGMKVSPFLRPLHEDPRWLPLLDKIGFPRDLDGSDHRLEQHV